VIEPREGPSKEVRAVSDQQNPLELKLATTSETGIRYDSSKLKVLAYANH
jgi:hypothetical protein